MTGILGALPHEIELLKAHMDNMEVETVFGYDFFKGEIHGKPVVAAVCGVGKVNAAVCAQTMIMKYSPDRVINTGAGGALSSDLRVCDVVVGQSCVQHDFDTTAFGDPIGFVSTVNITNFPLDESLANDLEKTLTDTNIRHAKGIIATGDVFVSEKARKEFIKDTFNASVCEMEGAAIAHTCFITKTPCAVLRAISDGADGSATVSYDEFAKTASNQSASALIHYIKNYA